MTWPVIWPAEAKVEEVDPALIVRAEHLAISTLRILTLGRLGGNTITVMPRSQCNWVWGYFSGFRWLAGHHPYPAAAHLKRDFWEHEAIVLDGPVGEVVEVMIDGVVVPPSQYAIEDGDKLVRLTGDGWPKGSGNDGFTVTYMQGFKVDRAGQYVAGVLAYEFLRSVTKPAACRLPKNVTSVNREGLTYEVSTAMFPNNSTGITEVDAYVWSWNPNALKVKPQVIVPGAHRRTRQRTWTP